MDLKILADTPPWEWPVDTDQMLLRILGDEQQDESDRLLAAKLAGDYTVINDELADRLLSMVLSHEESEPIRARAAISLGPALAAVDMDMFEDPEEMPISINTFHKIQTSLRDSYMDTHTPKEVRRRILEGSVRAPQDWHQKAIREAYLSDDPDWHLTAVFSMEYVSGFHPEILEAFNSEDENIQYHAVRASGSWEVQEAWPYILSLLTSGSTEKELVLAAIEAAANIRPQEIEDVLFDFDFILKSTVTGHESVSDVIHLAIGNWNRHL
ncbi:MAG: hypothetical protein R6U38_12595 [Desulfatiglandaceae bacterium]